MKNKGSKQKSKKKGSDNAFGCDLTEHLHTSGHDVPQVLKKCAEFIEKHGIVDGIYRLSGVTSNIQRLRQEFCSEACPDLTKEVYLQDIHCVGSLCKLYFRELPNPLLTYELYSKFTEVVKVQGVQEKLVHIQNVITELPSSHLRTLEYLTKHLAHLATLSTETNMHTRNLALVWAPNLLRSKDIEVASCNGDMAFQEVRVQQSVVEFILSHTEHIFNRGGVQIKPKEGLGSVCGAKYATLPVSGQCGPMKLMSLEEAQARSLSPNHPLHKERQREHSLPDASTATLYHTVIDTADNKRRFSGKSKKWKSIFNLGKSVSDTKAKLSRNGSVFIRGPSMTEKTLRPARSMESLCSLQTDDDRAGNASPVGGRNGAFLPDVKSRTLGSDSLCDVDEEEHKWDLGGKKAGGAAGGSSPTNKIRRVFGGSTSSPQQKALPEQLKVFKGEDLSGFQPTSPKNRRMLYSGSARSSSPSSSRPSFPGNFFPLESSPRHQRKAFIISEPFAVSVPLRVSAVISSNSTPCRAHAKDKPATAAMKPCRESPASEQADMGKSNRVAQLDTENQGTHQQKNAEETISTCTSDDVSEEVAQDSRGRVDLDPFPQLEHPSHLTAVEDRTPPVEKQLCNRPTVAQPDMGSCPIKTELWSVQQELKITEPEIDIMDETFKPILCPQSTHENIKLKSDVTPKRSCSSPALSLKEQTPSGTFSDLSTTSGSTPVWEQSVSDIFPPSHTTFHFVALQPRSLDVKDEKQNETHKVACESTPLTTDTPADVEHCKAPPTEQRHVLPSLKTGGDPTDKSTLTESQSQEEHRKSKVHQGDEKACCDAVKKCRQSAELAGTLRLSVCFENKRHTLELPNLDDEDVCGRRLEELDLVESWEDLSSTKQWVTSPLHSPSLTDLFGHLPMSPSSPGGGSLVPGEGTPSSQPSSQHSSHLVKSDKQAIISAKLHSGNGSSANSGNPETIGTYVQPLPARVNAASGNATHAHAGKSSAAKQRNALPSQRIHRQMSQEPSTSEKTEENCHSKHRPCSLNLDTGYRCIRDISNQQNLSSSELSSCQRAPSTPATANRGLSVELDAFLSDHRAPLRRNSAPVSVTSVRTAFLIKTCQAKAVPVVPPKVQYSQIPHSRQDKDPDAKAWENERGNANADTPAPPQTAADAKEELENKKPASKSQRQSNGEKSAECAKSAAASDLPVMMRRKSQNVDLFVDCPRPNRANLLQRPSFRNRQRPQSLILISPPFPIMDYPPLGDNSKLLLSPIKSLPDTSTISAFSKDMAAEGINLHSKMTIPKSGQRLETSTSCFYQPQRRSMIFDSRGHRQIE